EYRAGRAAGRTARPPALHPADAAARDRAPVALRPGCGPAAPRAHGASQAPAVAARVARPPDSPPIVARSTYRYARLRRAHNAVVYRLLVHSRVRRAARWSRPARRASPH